MPAMGEGCAVFEMCALPGPHRRHRSGGIEALPVSRPNFGATTSCSYGVGRWAGAMPAKRE